MPERALVLEPGAHQSHHRGLAAGIHRETTEEVAGRSDTGRLCKTVGREISYSGNRTLDSTATQEGGASVIQQYAEKTEMFRLISAHDTGNVSKKSFAQNFR